MTTTTDPRDYEQEHAAGGMSLWAAEDDPRRLAFTAARYKHTAKILTGQGRVLEVGCADGYWSRIVRQHVRHLTAIDTDRRSIEEALMRGPSKWPVDFLRLSLHEAVTVLPAFDAVFCLDVLEHIAGDGDFLRDMRDVAPVAVIGTPSLESQEYASPQSRAGHVNCYSGMLLRDRLHELWPHVFLFTMHDETLGTSFEQMAHYLLAVCVRGG